MESTKESEADNSLVKNVINNACTNSFEEISNRHEKLFYKICQKYVPAIKGNGLSKEDLFADKDFVLFQAIRTYRDDKETKFSTWLGNCSRYHCLNFLNANKRFSKPDEETPDYYLDKLSLEDFEEKTGSKSEKDFVFNILEQLKDKRIKKVFYLRYFKDFGSKKKPTWSRIAKIINTSTQTAINLHSRGKRILKTKIKSEEYYDKI